MKEPVTATATRLRAAVRCCELTRAMVQAAAKGEWDAVARLDRDRRAYIQNVALDPRTPRDIDDMTDHVRTLLELNRRVRDAAESSRDEALATLRAVRARRRASAAYDAESAVSALK